MRINMKPFELTYGVDDASGGSLVYNYESARCASMEEAAHAVIILRPDDYELRCNGRDCTDELDIYIKHIRRARREIKAKLLARVA